MGSPWKQFHAINMNGLDIQQEKLLLYLQQKNFSIPLDERVEFANNVGSKFLTEVHKQCADCEDEPEKFLDYLSQKEGLLMLLNLHQHGNQMSSGCLEMCTLLSSLFVLFGGENFIFDSSIFTQEDKLSPVSQIQHFTDALIDSNLYCKSPHNSVDTGNEIKSDLHKFSLKVTRVQLFYCFVSSFISVVQSSHMPKDVDVYAQLMEKTISHLSNGPDESNFSHGMFSMVSLLVQEVFKFIDESTINKFTLVFPKLFSALKDQLLRNSSPINLYIVIDAFYNLLQIINNLFSEKNNVHFLINIEFIKFFQSFVNYGYFLFIKELIEQSEKVIVDKIEDSLLWKDRIWKKLDSILFLIGTISKITTAKKNTCKNFQRAGSDSKKKTYAKHGKEIRKPDSTTENGSTTDKNDIAESEELSTEVISEVDNVLSYDENAQQIFRPEVASQKKDKEQKSDETLCFTSYSNSLLIEILHQTDDSQLQERTIKVLKETGLCFCVSVEQYLVDILNRLTNCRPLIADSILQLFSYILSHHQESLYTSRLFSTENGKKKHLVFKENFGKLYTTVEIHPFIPVLQNLLIEFKNETPLKIIKCLKQISNKLSYELQLEILVNLLLPIFDQLFSQPVKSNSKFNSERNKIRIDILDLCLHYIENHAYFAQRFVDYVSIEVLKLVCLNKNDEIFKETLAILKYLSSQMFQSSLQNQICELSSYRRFEIMSDESTRALLDVLDILLANVEEDKIIDNLTPAKCLWVLMNVINDLLAESDSISKSFRTLNFHEKCSNIFDSLIRSVTSDVDNLKRTLDYHISWMSAVLPLCLKTTDKEEHRDVFRWIERAFLRNLSPHLCERVLLTVIQVSVIYKQLPDNHSTRHSRDRTNSTKKRHSSKFGRIVTHLLENGYEADIESSGSEYDSHLNNRNNQLSYFKTQVSFSDNNKSSTAVPIIHHELMFVYIVEFLSGKCEDNFSLWQTEFVAVLNKILEYQLAYAENNERLSKSGILSILLKDFKILFTNKVDSGLKKTFENVVTLLSLHQVKVEHMKQILSYFKEENTSHEYLSTIFCSMVRIATKTYGPSIFVEFPAYSNHSKPKTDELQFDSQKSHSFNSRLLSVDVCAIKLPLESEFDWPENTFSFSVWFMLEDSSRLCCRILEDESRFPAHHRKLSVARSYNDNEEDLMHLFSFGASNALFEIWLGLKTDQLNYRWVTSNYGHSDAEVKYKILDQAVVVYSIKSNIWHNLIISVGESDAVHLDTTKVFTFVDGSALPVVHMKYPYNAVYGRTKLITFIGHQGSQREPNASYKSPSSKRVKLGPLMIFTDQRTNQATDLEKEENIIIIDKLKAIYLYALGPNNISMNMDYLEKSLNKGHMDSSLSWDSVLLKGLSFCIGILTEALVSDGFPEDFLESNDTLMTEIRLDLKNCLLLSFDPARPKEFVQYIPKYRLSGNIKHLFIDDVNNDSLRHHYDGVVNESTMSVNIQSVHRDTLQEALFSIGGVPVLVYLFGLVGERMDSQESQAQIMRSVFAIQEKCLFLQQEMNDCSGYALMNQVLESTNAKYNIRVIEALLDSICDGNIIIHTSKGETKINPNSSAIVKNACVLQIILKNCDLFFQSSTTVQQLLWSAFKCLIRQDHPHVKFNILQFQRVGFVEHLLIGCQEYLQRNSDKTLPETICQLYIDLVTDLLGNPPSLPVLKAICSFLIAIHPTVDSISLHSNKSFYLFGRKNKNLQGAYKKLLNIYNHKPDAFNTLRSMVHCHLFSAYTFSNSFKTITCGTMFENGQQYRNRGDASRQKRLRRRAASFSEGDYHERKSTHSAELIIPKENFYHGQVFKSEIVIHRPSVSLSVGPDADGQSGNILTGVNKRTLKFSIDKEDTETVIPQAQPKRLKEISKHRRIQSDGNVNLTIRRQPQKMEVRNHIGVNDTHDYDVISDSELFSSCEGSHDDYLVVDGIIEPTLDSFSPINREERIQPINDTLFYLRLGLFKLLGSTLVLLPDSLVTRVFGSVMKVEHLLALINQQNDELREIAFQNLFRYLQHGGSECMANFKRFMGCHLLANQLHLYPVTKKIIETSISLLAGKPVLFECLEKITLYTEEVCLAAVIPTLTILEGSMTTPSNFRDVLKFLTKVFDEIDGSLSVAYENGFAVVLANIVAGLAGDKLGAVNMAWKKETFGYLLRLVDWMVEKASWLSNPSTYQLLTDFLLELKNKEKRAEKTSGLQRLAHFLLQYTVQSALLAFERRENYVNFQPLPSRGYDDSQSSNTQQTQQSATRNILQKIRNTILVDELKFVSNSIIAAPATIQERFLEMVAEAVNMVTLFSKNDMTSETSMFGYLMKSLIDEEKNEDFSEKDADKEYCKDLLEWLFLCVEKALSTKTETSSWHMLLKAVKEVLILQTNWLILHVTSPLRSVEVKVHFMQLILKYKDNKRVLQCLLHANIVTKNRNVYLKCISSLLKIPEAYLNETNQEIRARFQKVANLNMVNVNEQKITEEIRGLKHKRKEEELSKMSEARKRMIRRNENLQERISSQGLEVSKVVVDEQDRQRQKLLRIVREKQSKQTEIRKLWRKLIKAVTAERAPWYLKENYPSSWQLDPTEGPLRIRKRMQRCHLKIAPRFFMKGAPAMSNKEKHDLAYLFGEGTEKPATTFSFKTNDTIRFFCPCKRVTPAANNPGEILIGETHLYFVVDEAFEDTNKTQAFHADRDIISLSWKYEEVKEIHRRRYSLKDNALEIFLTSGRTFLLAFEDSKNREVVYETLYTRELPNLVTATMDLNTLTQRWKNGSITNFEYLTELNKKAGRSFNDLMQYPVFPFILADYDCDILNMKSPNSFRNLSKPIACQDHSKEERYIENYQCLKDEYEQKKFTEPEVATQPYHYSSHYSNSGTVLHFLVRLPPFTDMFLKYQDNQFDIPDRTFHSVATTWKLSSFISTTDVKELIPEFFFLQEFLQNSEQYDMGVRQNGERVNDVILPKWCLDNPRLFMLIHMQALESYEVSSNLHNWIDLVFGYKQTGTAAIKATNVFHPSTYFGVDVSTIKNKIHQRALQTMIETYGQTPLQLFQNPHPKRFSKQSSAFMDIIPTSVDVMLLNSIQKDKVKPSVTETNQATSSEKFEIATEMLSRDQKDAESPLATVVGLNWGDYCGSRKHPPAVVLWIQTFPYPVDEIITSNEDISAYLCCKNSCILTKTNLNHVTKNIGVLQWGDRDQLLRIRKPHSDLKCVFNTMRPDKITCAVFFPEASILFVGGGSGIISVWPVHFDMDMLSLDATGPKQNLIGHKDAVIAMALCQPYSVIITTSKDKTAIIWDLNRLCYIRSLPEHEDAITCVSVSKSTGDIVTGCNKEGNAHIYLWTVNGNKIEKVSLDKQVNCVTLSNLHDGIAINVIVGGFQDGTIRFWDTWTLTPLKCLQPNTVAEPIIALSFSSWNPFYLFSSDSIGNVYLWSNKDMMLATSPAFVLASPPI